MMRPKCGIVFLVLCAPLLTESGCCHFDSDYNVDHWAYRAGSSADWTAPREPLRPSETVPAPAPEPQEKPESDGPSATPTLEPTTDVDIGSFRRGMIRTTSWQQPQKEQQPPTQAKRRFEVPPELPGADAPPLRLPAFDPNQTIEERKSLVESLFPDLPEIIAELMPSIPVDAHRYTLTELQQLAVENSPVLRQAGADVEEARGLAVQAGLYPNPIMGFEQDTVGTLRTAGYNGGFFNQQFITAGKLTKAQSVALMEMRSAEAALRRARVDLASNVRAGYFSVLVAQEQLKFNRAIAHLSEEVYQAQIDLVTGGEAAPYEPLQLRVLAMQARNSVVQAENRYIGTWRELAATLGLPQLQPSAVAGSVDMEVPLVDYHAASAFLLARHTDLISAQAQIAKAAYNLDLQRVTPIPNVGVYGAFQHDATTPLDHFSYNLAIGVPVPLFDRNQGNITAAHALNIRAQQDWVNARNTLLSNLAEVYNRYESSRTIAGTYRSDILRDQVRVYRGVYDRFREAGGTVDFAQVVVAQQTLAQVVTSYLQVLNDQWQATVDLAQLLQVDDFFAMDGLVGGAAAPMQPVPAPAAELPK